MKDRRALALLLGALVLAGCISLYWIIPWELDREGRRTVQAVTLRFIGWQALAYLHHVGRPPESVGDLFEQGYIAPHDRWPVVISTREPSNGCDRAYLDAVVLNFPAGASGYTVDKSGLVRGPDGRIWLLVDISSKDRSPSAVIAINRLLGPVWMRIVQGQPSGMPSIDEWPAPGNSGATTLNSDQHAEDK